ncbi:MAG TPA: hypothetical protein VII06_02030 [Chloroflexota bacterium]
MTTDRSTSPHRTNSVYPEAARDVGNGHTTTPTLDLIAEGVAAFAAAPDLAALGRALARRLARAASADQTTVWFTEAPGGASLALAAAWPTDVATAGTTGLSVADAPLAAEAWRRGAALRAHLASGPAALGLDGRREAPVWIVPLAAGARHVGLAYVVARPAAQQEHVGRVLTILGAQAALAALALTEPLAVRHEAAEFLAVAAHDLKNVATSIKGYTQLVRRNLPPELAPRAGRWTGIVEDQVGVLADTLSALVDLGRLHCGRAELDRQPADLRALIQAAVARLPAADAPPLDLLLPDHAIPGNWDTARLERALSAAFDSVRRGAQGDDPAPQVVVTAEGNQAHLCLGPSVPGEVWPAEGEWTTGADATFYLLRGFVEAHGGSASYRRTADGQPLLRITLPL